MNATRSHYAMPFGIFVALAFLAVALVPFLPFVSGQWWGMRWMHITIPISFLVADVLQTRPTDSTFLTVAISIACAAFWGGLAFAITRIFEAAIRKSE